MQCERKNEKNHAICTSFSIKIEILKVKLSEKVAYELNLTNKLVSGPR